MPDPRHEKASAEQTAEATQEVTGKPDPIAAGADQKEAPPFTVHEGGKGDQLHTLLDLPQFARWARSPGVELSEANLQSAWRNGVIDGYPGRIASATFKNNVLTVSGAIDLPDDALRQSLQEEFKEARERFPKQVSLVAIAEPPPGCDLNDPNTFVCHDERGHVVMVHQRYETKDGGKGFLPWTFWSDGQWRTVEPDVMPFYDLPGMQQASTLVLHEGAKATRHVRKVIEAEGRGHRLPWLADLCHAHHVGWIGGVNAVGRSDWSLLSRHGWGRVIIVADNDNRGIRAARRIARHFPANVFILTFDQRFVDGFDLADEWPSSLFDEQGAYIGPALRDCLLSATQATAMIPAEGRGRPTAVLRPEFAATVAYTLDPLRFISRHQPSRDRSADEFNGLVAPFSDVKDTATKVLGEAECQHDKLIWDPSQRAGTILKDGSRCFNVYEEPRIIAREGDATPWLDFIAHLIPNEEERDHLLRWLATLIAKPEVRMRWGILLISEAQGVGKGTLGAILRKMLGASNVSFPGTKEVSESQFNGWIARKRLAFVPELYSGHSRKTYDDLKSVMTDDHVTVNEKHIKRYEIDNWLHIIACSNSTRALHIDLEDRRWLVPTVSEQPQSSDVWASLYAWIEGNGPSIILDWARKYVARGNYVRTGDHAPRSIRKAQIAEKSQSDGAKLAVELAEHLVGIDLPVILRLSAAREWIALKRGFKRSNGEADIADRRLEKDDTLVRAMKNVPGITVWANNRRPKFAGVKDALLMNFEPPADATWEDIKDRLTTIEGVKLDDPL